MVMPGVQLHVPEAIDPEHRRTKAVRADLRLGQLEPGEDRRIERRPELGGIDTAGEVRSNGREDVTAVEGVRDPLEHVRAVPKLPRTVDTAEVLDRGQEQPVVGADVPTGLTGPHT